MKKMLCLALALVMALSLAIPAMAENNKTVSNGGTGSTTTAVTYNADDPDQSGDVDPDDPAPTPGEKTETWTVTVPAQTTPGATAGTVSVAGQWRASSTLKVDLVNANKDGDSKIVKMYEYGVTSDIFKTLEITFTGINKEGSDVAESTASTTIAVADWDATTNPAPLFGVWTGTITYSVTLTSNNT